MGRLDITAMEKDKFGTRALPDPMPEEIVAFFRKCGEEGPFTILLRVDEIPKDATYLQITVDFNEHAEEEKTRDPLTGEEITHKTVNIRMGQRGRYGNLIPDEHLAGPCLGWSYESYRRRQKDAETQATEADGTPREDVDGHGGVRSAGETPGSADACSGDPAAG